MAEVDRTKEIESAVLGFLKEAAELRLDLGDTDYDFRYIEEKLKACARIQEHLSDVAMTLTSLALEVNKRAMVGAKRLKREIASLTAQREYVEIPPNARESWIIRKTEAMEKEVDVWILLVRVVSEVRGAIGERAQVMKRLDSDIRQYQRLLEVKGASGATGPASRAGGNPKDLEL